MRCLSSFAFLLVWSCATAPIPRAGLQERLNETPEGGVIVLGAGEWTGDLVISKAVTLRGASEATALSGAISISARKVGLDGLRVVSSGTGLRVSSGAEVTLRHLRVAASGPGLRVEAHGVATVEDSLFECTSAAHDATAIEVAGQLGAARVEIAAGCRRGVDIDHAVAELHRITVHGPAEAGVRAVDAKVIASDLTVDGIGEKGAGLFAARSEIRGTNLKVLGGEEGLLLRDTRLQLEGLQAQGNRMSALALIGGQVDLKSGWLVGPFHEGALSALEGSQLNAADVDVQSAGATGLFAVGARVELTSVRVEGPRTDSDGDYGHGFILTRSQGRFRDVGVRNAAGAAIYVTNEVSTAVVDGCKARGVGAGIVAAIHGRVQAHRLDFSDTTVGLLAMRGGQIEVGEGSIDAQTGIATCAASSVVETGKLTLKSDHPRIACGEADGGINWHKSFNETPDWAPARKDTLGGHPEREKIPMGPR